MVFPFSAYIGSRLGLPYLQPSYGTIFIVAAMSLLMSFIIGPLASAYAAGKIGSSEIYTVMRENE
jgi:putative ABC transport system permease protein